MRSITGRQIFIFNLLMAACLLVGLSGARLSFAALPANEFRAMTVVLTALLLVYSAAILAYRLWLVFRPLPSGEIEENSASETTYHIHLLFFLMLFFPITRSGFLPVPLLRVFYQALGARFGVNSYTSGIIYDPMFVTIGAHSVLGQGSLIVPHAVEGKRLSHARITIGNNVTIGGNAVVLQGCVIEDDAQIGIGAVVAKNTHIKRGEIWLGIPAKRYLPSSVTPV